MGLARQPTVSGRYRNGAVKWAGRSGMKRLPQQTRRRMHRGRIEKWSSPTLAHAGLRAYIPRRRNFPIYPKREIIGVGVRRVMPANSISSVPMSRQFIHLSPSSATMPEVVYVSSANWRPMQTAVPEFQGNSRNSVKRKRR